VNMRPGKAAKKEMSEDRKEHHLKVTEAYFSDLPLNDAVASDGPDGCHSPLTSVRAAGAAGQPSLGRDAMSPGPPVEA
jgi:hypothetical protein